MECNLTDQITNIGETPRNQRSPVYLRFIGIEKRGKTKMNGMALLVVLSTCETNKRDGTAVVQPSAS